jgi:K+-transporting ATPase KdpF subunit
MNGAELVGLLLSLALLVYLAIALLKPEWFA